MARRTVAKSSGSFLTGATGSNNADVSVGDIALFNYGSTRSFSVAIRMRSTLKFVAGNKCMVGKCQGVGNFSGWRILATSDNLGRLFAQIGDGTANVVTTTVGKPFSFDGAWHKVLMEVDRTSQLLNFYVDNVLIESKSIAAIGSLDSTNVLRFFRDGAGNNRFGGDLDSVRIFNGIMTSKERNDFYYDDTLPRNVLDGQWLFDEGSGATALDTSGNGNNGTINVLTYSTNVPAGKTRGVAVSRAVASTRTSAEDMGTALDFNGTNAVITTPINKLKFNVALPFTVGFWYRPSDDISGRGILGMWSASLGQRNFGFSILGAGGNNRRCEFKIRDNADTDKTVTISNQIKFGEKYFIVGRFSGTQMDLYINGVWSSKVAVVPYATGDQALIIGRFLGASVSFSKSILDAVLIYQASLTDEQIALWHKQNVTSRQSLIAEYKFDEASGTTAIDSSGNGNDATIGNGVYVLSPFRKARTATI